MFEYYDHRKKLRGVLFLLSLILGALLAVVVSGGCQIDTSAGIGAKMFYPDQLGENGMGDPRKPMYDGSGYGERHTAGSESGMTTGPSFKGMNVDDAGDNGGE